MELWNTTTFFSRNIIYFDYSNLLGHPLETKKDQAVSDVKEDILKNLEIVRTARHPHNYNYAFKPNKRGYLEKKDLAERDYLSASLLITGNSLPEQVLDQNFVDFGIIHERSLINGFLDKLKTCVSFDGGLQHMMFNRAQGDLVTDDKTLPSICPCGYLMSNWRKENNLVGRKSTEIYDKNHPFPFCTDCDDRLPHHLCYVHPNGLLKHLYSKAETCALHLVTLLYLFRLYEDLPYVNKFCTDHKEFAEVTSDVYSLEKMNSEPPDRSLFSR